MRARALLALLALLTLVGVAPLVGSAAAAPAWKPRAASYGVALTRDVGITMSDGVRLNADVLRPARADGTPAPGRFPVLLTQTPYNKNAPSLNFRSDYLVSRGYVQVIVDVRGTGGSGGTWDSFGSREQRDGYELVGWAARQPWSDGRVGLHGTSYGAINQFFTAAQQPPALKAMFPVVPMADSYRDISASGGQVNTSFIPFWLGLVTGTGLLPPTYTANDPVQAARVLAGHAGGVTGFQTGTVVSATTGGAQAYDGPFYRQRSPIEVVDRVRVPTFVVGGWYDLFQRGEPLLYQRLRANGVPSRLLVGPWDHLSASSGEGLPADGVPSLDALELRWMDRYLAGRPDPTLGRDLAQVTYNELGTGRWVRADGWPARDTRAVALPLAGPAAPGSPGRLGAPRPSGAPDTLVANPLAGVCTRSTSQWSAGLAAGTPCDTDNRVNDLTGLSYDYPLARDLRLLGPITAQLYVSSPGGRNGQLTVRVEDVAPDGTATQLTAGWQVLSLRGLDVRRSVYRNGLLVRPYHPFTRASERPMPDGTPVRVDVEVFPTGALLRKGHTLRLSLQTADEPHLTPTLPQFAASGAALQVWHDAARPSRLVLTVRR